MSNLFNYILSHLFNHFTCLINPATLPVSPVRCGPLQGAGGAEGFHGVGAPATERQHRPQPRHHQHSQQRHQNLGYRQARDWNSVVHTSGVIISIVVFAIVTVVSLSPLPLQFTSIFVVAITTNPPPPHYYVIVIIITIYLHLRRRHHH